MSFPLNKSVNNGINANEVRDAPRAALLMFKSKVFQSGPRGTTQVCSSPISNTHESHNVMMPVRCFVFFVTRRVGYSLFDPVWKLLIIIASNVRISL